MIVLLLILGNLKFCFDIIYSPPKNDYFEITITFTSTVKI